MELTVQCGNMNKDGNKSPNCLSQRATYVFQKAINLSMFFSLTVFGDMHRKLRF